jgi:hypothetical protein
MILTTIDKNNWYRLDIEKAEWSEDREPCISFELNNLSEETKYPVPNETGFIMSIQDAKELYAWLGCVLNY